MNAAKYICPVCLTEVKPDDWQVWSYEKGSYKPAIGDTQTTEPALKWHMDCYPVGDQFAFNFRGAHD